MKKNLYKKDLIIDDGIIRQCYGNIEKMTILEYIYCYVFHWGWIQDVFIIWLWGNLKQSIYHLFGFILNLILFITMPITLPFHASRKIKIAKKICSESREKQKLKKKINRNVK